MMRFLIAIVVSTVLLASCEKQNSADVNQQSIYTIYELRYDADNDVTTARATFRFGGEVGTLLELTDPAYCSFEEEKLAYNKLLGYHEKQFSGFIPGGTFVYGDQDEMVYTNYAREIDPINFNTVDSIGKSLDFEYFWSGNPVGENETVTMTVSSSSSSDNQKFTTITESDTSILLTSGKLDNFGTGWATFTLKRAYNQSDLDEGTQKGGRITISYSISKDIYIKP